MQLHGGIEALKQLIANVGKGISLYPLPLRQKKNGERDKESTTHTKVAWKMRKERRGKGEKEREEEGACLAAPGHGTKG